MGARASGRRESVGLREKSARAGRGPTWVSQQRKKTTETCQKGGHGARNCVCGTVAGRGKTERCTCHVGENQMRSFLIWVLPQTTTVAQRSARSSLLYLFVSPARKQYSLQITSHPH